MTAPVPEVRLPRAASVTHEHLFACVNTVIEDRLRPESDTAPLRILDAGCGDGRLMVYLTRCLELLQADRKVEIYGFDVLDHGVQPLEFMQKTLSRLEKACPNVDWSRRISGINADQPWPYEEAFFDMVVSNQVLEHVKNHRRFFREQFRVLASGGYGFHLFPLKHYVYEGHLLLPWVHRWKSWDYLRSYIHATSKMRLGKYPTHHRETGVTCEEFSERHADYIYFLTNYLTEGEVLDISRSVGFRASFRFSKEFYLAKVRSLCKREPRQTYRAQGRAASDAIWVKLLRYLSSVTLTLRKENAY